MPLIQLIAQGISAVLFLGYGAGCFFSKTMILEFDRYRLPNLRILTGALQIAGGIGIIAGHFYKPFLLLSAGGLALMMLVAFITRIRIRDPFLSAIPSLSLLILNSYIFVSALRQ
jgi:hypothetical protein